MATKAEILNSMQLTGLFESKINRVIDDVSEGTDATKIITYQFAADGPPDDFFGASYDGWTEFGTTDKTAVANAMAQLESFLNVKFVEYIEDDATEPDLNLGKADIPGATPATAGYQRSTEEVDLNDNPDDPDFQTQVTEFDSFALFSNDLDLEANFNRVLQILGHAMGLKNSFVGPVVPEGTDNNKFTVMSNQVDPDTGELSQTYQIYDIIAMQDLWGANTTLNTGDDSYLGDTDAAIQLVMDAGGTDIFDASAQTESVTLDLREGAFSTFDADHQLLVAYDSIIENATGGSGDDMIDGNDADNLLKGGKGKDVMAGYDGDDVLRGSQGKDELRGGNGADKLHGNLGNDKLFGGNGADKLFGGNGKDKLYGGGGKDTLEGGADADTFVFGTDFGKDTIVDFQNDLDILKINRDDVTTTDEALAFAEDVGGDIVFSFDDGSKITVQGISIADLSDDISIA